VAIIKRISKQPVYGKLLNILKINTFDVDVNFVIYKTQDLDEENPFKVGIIKTKNKESDNIDEEIKNIYLIRTDEIFRKKFNHYYDVLKLETENNIITFGAYSDSKNKPNSDNISLLCTIDFINLLAPITVVTDYRQLKDTPFKFFGCLLEKKELSKILLQ
jgi:hypothetical protein